LLRQLLAGHFPHRLRLQQGSRQKTLPESSYFLCRGKQSGMAGDPAQAGGIFVVNLPLQAALSPRTQLGGGTRDRDRGWVERIPWIKLSLAQAQRPQDPGMQDLIQTGSAQTFQSQPQQDQSKIAVDCAGSWSVGKKGVQSHVPGRFGIGLSKQGPPGGQTGGVGQQLPHRHLFCCNKLA
jgi:hypothetical protein